MTLRDRQKEVIFALGLFLTVLVCVLLGEGLARFLNLGKADETFDWRAFRNAAMEPVQAGERERFIPGAEFGGIRINDLGYRGPDVPVPKPARTVRLVFLGDSKFLGMEMPYPETIPGRAMALLAQRLEGCALDHVMLAGPGYTLGHLTRAVAEERARLEPDLFVLLGGSLSEVLAARRSHAPNAIALMDSPQSDFLNQSRLYKVLVNQVRRAREAVGTITLDRVKVLPDARVRALSRELIAGLGDAIGTTPVVALAYRGMLRTDLDGTQQDTVDRLLMHRGYRFSTEQVAQVSDLIADELEAVSAERGWRFLDPIASIPPDKAHFFDLVHLRPNAAAMVAEEIAETIAPMVRLDFCPTIPG